MTYIVASATKAKLSESGLMCAGDLPEALSTFVEAALVKAAERAKANGRKTVRPEDL
ncbi:NFYB/HAP3 family transcription factor subunit [Candidatus Parcubacteria bacterium]|nr:NFYB/HAP3 family transcription factor subunit [Candidatus Parcubacteria bacterium]